MGAGEILHSAGRAFSLIGAAPWALLLAVLIFFLCGEALQRIPRAGLLLKLCVTALLAPQVLAMFRVASLGEVPPLRILADFIYLPPASMLVVVGCALLPLLAGLASQAALGVDGGVRRGLLAKACMTVSALPFTYVAPAMVLKGYIGANALKQGLLAALVYWPSLLALLLVALAYDLLAAWLPRRAAPPLAIGCLLFLFAFTYALSARVFGV